MTTPEAFIARMAKSSMETHLCCVYCGRTLIEVEERDSIFDRKTGERRMIVWRQCPKFPGNGFMSMFSGVHEKFQRDNPMIGIEYR